MTTTTKKNKIQGLEEEEPNPEGGGGGGSTSSPPPPLPDRISELPVEILHCILGFLEMDEFLIGTSLVSTKWRNLWKSVSTLKFPDCNTSRRIVDDNNGSGGGGGIRNNVAKYHNFVDHVLRLRDSQTSKIEIFNCSCSPRSRGGYDYLESLHNFIVSAVVNQGAQEIQIMGSYLYQSGGGGGGNIIHFNPSIFTSGLLRVFNFTVHNSHFLIQFPVSMCCATQLTHLTLYNIRLPEGQGGSDELNAQLHLVCPVLDTLYLHRCYCEHLKVLDISAPRLNYLTICNTGMRHGYLDGLGGCRLEIHTPYLTSFQYSGCVFVDCFTENLPRVTIAHLRLSKEPDMVEKTNSFAIKLLKRLTSAHCLTLAGFEDTSSAQLTPFTRLKTLCLRTSCNISSINGMVHILNNCNSLEVLSWTVDEVGIKHYVQGDNDEYLMLPQCRLSRLKHVCIKNLLRLENDIEFVKFVKFVLKSSIVLEEIIINTTRNSSKISIEENLKQFIEEEPSFRRSIKLQVF